MMQVMIASVAVAGLATLIGSMMKGLNKAQSTVRLANVATDLESRHRAAVLSSRALYNSRTSPNNSELASCFTAGCTLGTAAPFELLDSAGNVLVPKAQPAYVNDAGNVCNRLTDGPTCQWRVTATYTPKCSGACTTPSSYDLKMTIDWEKSVGATENFAFRTKEIAMATAKEMFVAPPTTTQCNLGEVMTGLNPDGTPNCRSLTSADLGPSILKSVGLCPGMQMLKGFDPATGARDCVPLQIECVVVSGACAAGYEKTGIWTFHANGGGAIAGFALQGDTGYTVNSFGGVAPILGLTSYCCRITN